MKRTRQRLATALRCTEVFLWVAGCAAFAYCTYIVVQARLTQTRLSHFLEHERQLQTHPHSQLQATATHTTAAAARSNTLKRDLVGRLKIPKLGLSAMILEGDDTCIMGMGLGHIPGTSAPGQPGNIGIAGHRDTFLRPLRHIDKGDEVILETAAKTYYYRVSSIEIVEPQNVAVLSVTKNDELTLVTCYPFSYIGPAPRRFVVHADAVKARKSSSTGF